MLKYCVEGCGNQVHNVGARCRRCSAMHRDSLRFPTGPGEWHDHATCRGSMDARIFPRERGASSQQVRAGRDAFIAENCARCPVRSECFGEGLALMAAFGPRYVYGVWGGVDWCRRSDESMPQWRRRVGIVEEDGCVV